jgi:hypothetical protein
MKATATGVRWNADKHEMKYSFSVATLRDISLFEGYLTPSRDRGIFMLF